jgi:hypothetical protein
MTLPSDRGTWPAKWKELWAERSALMQFEAGLTQFRAEQEAERDIRKVAEREK